MAESASGGVPCAFGSDLSFACSTFVLLDVVPGAAGEPPLDASLSWSDVCPAEFRGATAYTLTRADIARNPTLTELTTFKRLVLLPCTVQTSQGLATKEATPVPSPG